MLDHLLNEFLVTGEMDAVWLTAAQQLALADQERAKVFNITEDNVAQVILERSHLLKSVFPTVNQFCQKNLSISTLSMLQLLWDLWLPWATKMAVSRESLGRTFIQGILGVQGTGKTTMCQILSIIFEYFNYKTLSLSLDDLYKTYSDRQALQKQDPRLIWRGPPGTHDINLGLSVLTQIRQGESSVTVPQFDKSAYAGAGDRTTPKIVTDIDIVLFEGWFVGVVPIDPQLFDSAPPPIITAADRLFAREMNEQLQTYLPLWERLDSLIVLDPQDYHYSFAWRKQAEQKMIAAGKSGMNDAQIEEFVNYFWRSLHPELFIPSLLQSSQVEFVVKVNHDHSFTRIYTNK
ncbi:MAG: glycerate kinase [Sphaerospermopsis sp. SIO1G2]|nr:glycerate kinase [Sphaerospermopsis sp. SIO1G2]